EALAAEFAGDHQVRCFALDGYQAVRAFLPPRERRGLVLVDPPFEVPDEFDRLAALLRDGLARWETGTFLLWYPIKHARQVDDFLSVAGSICAARPTLSIQLLLSPPDGLRLAGCGLVVVNPPYTLATEMAEILPYLEQTLGLGAPASGHIRWLANAPD
ncbi:MAG: 23S rRNA (adenine(2030)-N(6))-methyltransferase RlmJ, partial [Alphaproteobacteria bacterium]|nr:23S rRNA (adenine(2030)-N(6))-methyltransferase RlmJ [Alphaproteobacteria bacterium]